MRPAAQQQLLDAHGRLQDRVRAVAAAHAAWRAAARAAADAEAAQAQHAAEAGAIAPAARGPRRDWRRWPASGNGSTSEQRRLANARGAARRRARGAGCPRRGRGCAAARGWRACRRAWPGLLAFDPRLGRHRRGAGQRADPGRRGGARTGAVHRRAARSTTGRLAHWTSASARCMRPAANGAVRRPNWPPLHEQTRLRLARLADGQDLAALQRGRAARGGRPTARWPRTLGAARAAPAARHGRRGERRHAGAGDERRPLRGATGAAPTDGQRHRQDRIPRRRARRRQRAAAGQGGLGRRTVAHRPGASR